MTCIDSLFLSVVFSGSLSLECSELQFIEVMGNCLDCLNPQPEVETPDPVSDSLNSWNYFGNLFQQW